MVTKGDRPERWKAEARTDAEMTRPTRNSGRSRTVPSLKAEEVRDLFRHLGAPHLLARNGIAIAFFRRRSLDTPHSGFERETDAIRLEVLEHARRFRSLDTDRAGTERAERRYQGIVRGDLERVPAKKIAADLGISVRQLRRDRNYARARIAHALIEPTLATPATSLLDGLMLEVGLARRLADSGRAGSAIQMLRTLANSDLPLRRRVDVLIALIEVLIDCELRDEAAMTIGQIDSLVSDADRDSHPSTKRMLAAAMVDLAGPAHVARPYDLFTDGLVGPSAQVQTIVAILSIAHTRSELARGAWTAARGHVNRLRSLLAQKGVGTPQTAVDSLILESHLRLARSGDLQRTRITAMLALETAQREGLERRSSIAGRHVAYVEFLMGHHNAAVATAMAALEMAKRAGDLDVLASATLGLADLEIMVGRVASALRQLQTASDCVARGSLYWSQLQLRLADVFLRQKSPERAIGYARAARDAAADLGNLRFVGAALRRCAQAEFALGNQSNADETIKSAMGLLRSNGTRHGLVLGNHVSLRITGPSDHTARSGGHLPADVTARASGRASGQEAAEL